MSIKTHFPRLGALLLAAVLTGCGAAAAPAPSMAPETEAPTQEVWGLEVTEAPPPTEAPKPAVTPSPSPTPAPSPTPEPTPEPDPLEAAVQETLDRLTLEEKVAQLFVITPESLAGTDSAATAAGEATRSAFDTYPVGGLIYMGENLLSRDQAEEMLSATRSISRERIGLTPFLCVDEEGGSVARISGVEGFGIEGFPDMNEVGASGDPEQARSIGTEMGQYLRDLGFNVDFAPVADVLTNSENTVVKYRSFGSDPETVTAMTAAFTQGLQSQGVLGCYKHFPGHGGTAADSHQGYAYADATLEDLRQTDLVPFRDGAERQVPFIMVGHISLPGATAEDLPASLSREMVTGILREELGYEGIVITDGMNMGAISQNYSSADGAVLAFEAGVDMILMPVSFREAYHGILEAVESGRISRERLDESLRRILRVKLRYLAE